MSSHRHSFTKTTLIAGALSLAGGAAVIATLALAREAGAGNVSAALVATLVAAAIACVTTWFLLVAVGGLIALQRDALEAQGKPYARYERREALGPAVVARWWAAVHRLLAGGSKAPLRLRPGEWVEVRSLDEICATLDAEGRLNGVPFMSEMAAWCGRRVRVFRRADKLNDWINSTGLKRMGDLVLLEDIRCDGSAHGGCQSNCHLRWREAWLRRAEPPATATQTVSASKPSTELLARLDGFARRVPADGAALRYMCQATELTAGGRPIHRADLRHYARDLFTGNVRPRLFFTGIAVASFNWVQGVRGGAPFPFYQCSAGTTSPHETLDLQPGETVRVKPKHLIEPTLNFRSRNRGLYFDREMIRFCGGEYRVKARAERVIIEKTGEFKALSYPCIILEESVASGEHNRFNPENEHIFWREIWLERVSPPRGAANVDVVPKAVATRDAVATASHVAGQ